MSPVGSRGRSKTRSSLRHRLLDFFNETGLIRTGRGLWAQSLTVLNYHRIGDPDLPTFDTFRPNISATPEQFNAQMDYVGRWFNVVSVQDVLNWLDGHTNLPPFAALISFDDGYLDNYRHAYPILRAHQFPAVIFLATDHIGTDRPFFWDLAAYCFHHTRHRSISFPDGDARHWTDVESRMLAAQAWTEQLKSLPESEKGHWVEKLPAQLDVSIPPGFFQNLMLTWDLVREMRQNGIDFGAHSMRHPILTRIPLDAAEAEVAGSKSRIEAELGRPVHSFAYPNGQVADFNGDIERIVSKCGIRMAFSLLNGPSSLKEVKQNPLAIRRIFVSHKHSLGHFAFLLSRLNRYDLF